ncbi:MAG: mechanosensitive ion channel family protein [Planctomycetota bacterium]|jgi:miniconductance mechanosensitive channel
MGFMVDWLIKAGLSQSLSITIVEWTQLIVVLAIGLLLNFVAKKIILHVVQRVIKRSKTTWDDALLKRRVFHRLSHLAPAILFYLAAPMVFFASTTAQNNMRLAATIYIIATALLVLDAFLNSVVDVSRRYSFFKKTPIKGFIQVIKIILAILGGIMVLGMITDKDPTKIIAGLGAMTAVLLLIFKDAILGLVAGIQLSANNMVHIGDWIAMPKYGADGDVIDISLTTVKVQNWDKTISTIPAYSLISDSFVNWRGMSESGGRRIKRSVNLDMTSVRFCDEAMLDKFRKIQYISDYINDKKREIDEHNKAANVDDSQLVNGRRMTNVGTFRAYVIAYLKHHPKIHKEMTFLVRQLAPNAEGLPIQIYVFSNDQVWANYEAIQADIFDHVLAVMPEFGLRVFQNPTGADFRTLSAPGR